MRFSLSQLLLLVTIMCLVCGLLAQSRLALLWSAGVMAMFAGAISTMSFGRATSTRWWRITLSAWLGLLLFVGVLFSEIASIAVVEVLWLTGLPALVIGTSAAVTLRGAGK